MKNRVWIVLVAFGLLAGCASSTAQRDVVQTEDYELIPREAAIDYINRIARGSRNRFIQKCVAGPTSFNNDHRLRYDDFAYQVSEDPGSKGAYMVIVWRGRSKFMPQMTCHVGYAYGRGTAREIAAALASLGGRNMWD